MRKLIEHKEAADIESSSFNYADRFAGEIGKYFLDVQEKIVVWMLSQLEGQTVLDVGGGHGQITLPLVKKGYDVTVIGSSKVCNSLINENSEIKGCYKFIVGDLLNLPIRDRVYDFVVSFRLLPHVIEWKKLIGELTRIAKVGVLIDFPTITSINIVSPLLFHIKKKIEKNTRPYFLFMAESVKNEFEKNGFRCADIKGQYLFPMALHRWMGKNKALISLEGMARNCGLTDRIGSPVVMLAANKNFHEARWGK